MDKEKEELQHKARHTASHVLAGAIKSLYGEDVKFGIGPAIEDGFYYDFDFDSDYSLLAYHRPRTDFPLI